MPEPYKRSRTLRRMNVKLPGGRTTLHYKERNRGKAKCGKCRALLHGIIRGRNNTMKNTHKSSKHSSRPYTGNLCSKCMRSIMIEKARL